MVRVRTFTNTPVIIGEKQLGLLQRICLDDEQKQVSSLIVACGLTGKRMVPAAGILQLGSSFIFVDQALRYTRALDQRDCLFARDAAGLLVGRISDAAIDVSCLRVIALELSTGYLFSGNTKRIWVYDYTRPDPTIPEIRIPACMGSELTARRRE